MEQLVRLKTVGPKGAWVLVKEVFGWRTFANRREFAGSLGLVPTPHASGSIEHEQGIGKAGNRRVRSLLVELAWSWLRLQPDSALTRWFNRRFAGSGGRMRRVGIVALATRLAIALRRYAPSITYARCRRLEGQRQCHSPDGISSPKCNDCFSGTDRIMIATKKLRSSRDLEVRAQWSFTSEERGRWIT